MDTYKFILFVFSAFFIGLGSFGVAFVAHDVGWLEVTRIIVVGVILWFCGCSIYAGCIGIKKALN